MPTENESEPTLQDLARIAAPIAKNAHMRSILLREISAEKLIGDEESAPLELEFAGSHRLSHRLVPESPDRSAQLFVDINFDLKIRGVEHAGESLGVASIQATLGLRYDMSRGMPEEAKDWLSAFAQTNSLIHAWPYYRELVQSTAWRMGLPPFSLPLFQVGGPRALEPATEIADQSDPF